MCLCSGQPSTFANVASYRLAGVTISAGDLTISAATGGEDMSFAAKASVLASVTGTIDHVAVVGTTALLFVTTATAKAVTIGDQVNIPAWRDLTAYPT